MENVSIDLAANNGYISIRYGKEQYNYPISSISAAVKKFISIVQCEHIAQVNYRCHCYLSELTEAYNHYVWLKNRADEDCMQALSSLKKEFDTNGWVISQPITRQTEELINLNFVRVVDRAIAALSKIYNFRIESENKVQNIGVQLKIPYF